MEIIIKTIIFSVVLGGLLASITIDVIELIQSILEDKKDEKQKTDD